MDSGNPEPVDWQLGVVRTNCMDNLDRTNVAQAATAKWTLNRQLKAIGVLAENDTVDNHEEFNQYLRESTIYCLFSISFGILNLHVCSVVRPCRLHLEGVRWYRRPQDRLHPYW